jgi:hypothetical protein
MVLNIIAVQQTNALVEIKTFLTLVNTLRLFPRAGFELLPYIGRNETPLIV